jgi:hypothetical protein
MAPTDGLRRLGGLGVALTGFVCPCHALTGVVLGLSLAISGSAPALSPALQDGVHSVYLPAAVLTAAWLLRPKARPTA